MRNSIIESVDLSANSNDMGRGIEAFLSRTMPALASISNPFPLDVEEINPESEIVYSEGGSVVEEEDNKGTIIRWHIDAMPQLPAWDLMGKKPSSEKVEKVIVRQGDIIDTISTEVASIQRLLFWFPKGAGSEIPIPAIAEVAVIEESGARFVVEKATKFSTKGRIIMALKPEDKIGWTRGCDPESRTILPGCPALLVNGWLVNGVALKSAMDGNEEYGVIQTDPKNGAMMILKSEKGALQMGLQGRENESEGWQLALVRLLDTLNGVRFNNPMPGFGQEEWGSKILVNLVNRYREIGESYGLVEDFFVRYNEKADEMIEKIWDIGRIKVKKNVQQLVKEIAKEIVTKDIPLATFNPDGSWTYEGYSLLPKPWEMLVEEKKEGYFGHSRQEKAVQAAKCRIVARAMREQLKLQVAILKLQKNEFVQSQFNWLGISLGYAAQQDRRAQIEGHVEYDSCREIGGKFVRQSLRMREEEEKSWLK